MCVPVCVPVCVSVCVYVCVMCMCMSSPEAIQFITSGMISMWHDAEPV